MRLVAPALLGVLFGATLAFADEPLSGGQARPACENLAEAIDSDDNQDAQIETLLKATYDALERQSPSLLVLEDAYPGLRVAVTDAIRAPVRENVQEATPLYRAELAQFYCANLSSVEVSDSVSFWTSPTGRKFLAGVNRTMGYSATAEQFAAEKDVEIAQFRKDAELAGMRAALRMTPEERMTFLGFFRSPSGQKLFSLNERKNAIDVKWMNYAPEGKVKEIEQIVTDTMIAHIARTDPETAKKIQDSIRK